MSLYDALKFLHIITVVFMAAPLYNLVVVNERVRFGKAHLDVDRYFENLIRGNAIRCYVFQVTALVTGVWLAVLGHSFAVLYTNGVLLAKFVLLLTLMVLLSVVHFSIQPRIDGLLAEATGDALPPALAARIGPLRVRRKRLAAICLFLVITTVILGLQVFARFTPPTTIVLVAVAAMFAWRVYRSRVAYGWM